MFAYVVKRLLTIVPILLGISVVIFIVADSMPGDVLDVMVNPTLGREQMALRRAQLGLDLPVHIRYWQWLKHAVRFDLGYSMITREPVVRIIADRVPKTVTLMGTALFVSLLFAIPAGVVSAIRRYSLFDSVFTIGAFAGISIPTFFLGLILIYVFSVKLGVLPSGGTHSFAGQTNPFWDALRHLVLPTTTLGLFYMASFTRYIRSTLIDVMSQPYVDTARAKGVAEALVILRHAGRNALIPVITLLGLRIPFVFGGAVLAETVFSWPGMGRLLVTSVYERDSAVLVGITVMLGLLVVLSNLLVDMVYVVVDPRIRYSD